MSTIIAFVGRLMLSLLFIVSGASKLFDTAGTEMMITGVGLPGGLAIPTGIFELLAGLALAFGVMTRLFAVLLAGFCLLAAFFFHNNFVDPMQAAMLLKNIAIAGGLMCLIAQNTMRWSYDAMRERRRSEIAAHDSEERAHQAEIRATRAEAVAETARSEKTVITSPIL